MRFGQAWLRPMVVGMNSRFAYLPIVLAIMAAALGQAFARPRDVSELLKTPMIFYLAKGSVDLCGPGCNEWIAAEGLFDPGAEQRLRKFLDLNKHHDRPIIFNSPGGLT